MNKSNSQSKRSSPLADKLVGPVCPTCEKRHEPKCFGMITDIDCPEDRVYFIQQGYGLKQFQTQLNRYIFGSGDGTLWHQVS